MALGASSVLPKAVKSDSLTMPRYQFASSRLANLSSKKQIYEPTPYDFRASGFYAMILAIDNEQLSLSDNILRRALFTECGSVLVDGQTRRGQTITHPVCDGA